MVWSSLRINRAGVKAPSRAAGVGGVAAQRASQPSSASGDASRQTGEAGCVSPGHGCALRNSMHEDVNLASE